MSRVRTQEDAKLSKNLLNEYKSLIDERFLALMRCPIDGTELANADAELVQRLNRLIGEGKLRDLADQLVQEPIDGALVTADNKWVYAVRGGIPSLIADEAMTAPEN